MKRTVKKLLKLGTIGLAHPIRSLTPSNHFRPTLFFYELVFKPLFKQRSGIHRVPHFKPLKTGEVAITWIGHSSFLIQFNDLSVLIDPNFANWLFMLKRLKLTGIRLKDLPPIDVILITHCHHDHFHKPTLRRLPSPKFGIMPWGTIKLTQRLGFKRVVELEWWETLKHNGWKVSLTPAKHWGARYLHDSHRGYGGFIIEHQGRVIYHAGDTAYFDGFKEIYKQFKPEIALLPIGASHPESFRHVHMSPEDAIKAFYDLRANVFIPMHYGHFKLAFEELDAPSRRLKEIAEKHGVLKKISFLEEGVPKIF
ncbi:MAG: MBL fold metallo-hydrolase [Verrucomicrobiia bacterium]